MSESARAGLIEAAGRMLELAQNERAVIDLHGAELSTLYEIIGHTARLLHGYTVTDALPELQAGASAAAAELHRAMNVLEDAWIARYPTPITNVIPLRRAA